MVSVVMLSTCNTIFLNINSFKFLVSKSVLKITLISIFSSKALGSYHSILRTNEKLNRFKSHIFFLSS